MYKMLREDLDYIGQWLLDEPIALGKPKTIKSRVRDLLEHYIRLEKEAPQCFDGGSKKRRFRERFVDKSTIIFHAQGVLQEWKDGYASVLAWQIIPKRTVESTSKFNTGYATPVMVVAQVLEEITDE